ncbi:Eae-like protein [Salmonella enterica]|nr:Eae-like protein [Salmonella enterica]EHL8723939.1 Eae-like protein [Salmonella enterica]EHM5284989.1 Eae-like protein [Salmonella enterica]
MEGFLRGKCIPGDLKVNETNAEYLVIKFSEEEERCAVLSAKLSMINDLMKAAEQANKLAQEATENLVQERNALAAENTALKKSEVEFNEYCRRECEDVGDTWVDDFTETPATDAFLAEMRAQAHKEGAYFVANRMLAAWDAGFIDGTAKNAADIARMILTSTEFMADAPEGDFDRSFADGVIEDIAAQLRKGVQS